MHEAKINTDVENNDYVLNYGNKSDMVDIEKIKNNNYLEYSNFVEEMDLSLEENSHNKNLDDDIEYVSLSEILANILDNISDKTEALLLSYISKEFCEINFEGPESIEETIKIIEKIKNLPFIKDFEIVSNGGGIADAGKYTKQYKITFDNNNYWILNEFGEIVLRCEQLDDGKYCIKNSLGIIKFYDSTGKLEQVMYSNIISSNGMEFKVCNGTIFLDFGWDNVRYNGDYFQTVDSNGVKYVIPLCGFEKDEQGEIYQVPYTEQEIENLLTLFPEYYDGVVLTADNYSKNFKDRVSSHLDTVVFTKVINTSGDIPFGGLKISNNEVAGRGSIIINFAQMMAEKKIMEYYFSTYTHELAHIYDSSFCEEKNGVEGVSLWETSLWDYIYNIIYTNENGVILNNLSMNAASTEWYARSVQIYYKEPEKLKNIEINVNGFNSLYDFIDFSLDVSYINNVLKDEPVKLIPGTEEYNDKYNKFKTVLNDLEYGIDLDGKTINIQSIIDKFNQDKVNGNNTYIYVDEFNLYNELGELCKEDVVALMKITAIRNDDIVVNFEGNDYVIKFLDDSLVTIVSL